MQVGLHANMCDQATSDLASALSPVFRDLSNRLAGEYGGMMEHLWIDLELIEHHARVDGGPRHPFRFQKRVSGRSRFGLPPQPDSFNVGHFSVRPDFFRLKALSIDQAIPYVLQLIYDGTAVLIGKGKRLGGFDAPLFRTALRGACVDLGYVVVA
jgi:hypothetical protein